MEPIRLWRWKDRMGVTGATTWHDSPLVDGMAEYAALPRADFDALVKRDRTCPLCGDELDPDEADYDSVCPPAGAGVCSRCFARWHDAPVYEKRAAAATARADKAEAALKDALARIDAHLAAKGQAAPTPADPTNHAPKATSADGCTEQKEA
jgi:predicted RNA-binding Zn-ribbon protein involved in translation (DUF1610 family)